jgi:hypothetical protein
VTLQSCNLSQIGFESYNFFERYFDQSKIKLSSGVSKIGMLPINETTSEILPDFKIKILTVQAKQNVKKASKTLGPNWLMSNCFK